MPQKDPSRTEAPTGKRIKKARGEGSVPKSQEAGKAFVVLAGVVGLWLFIGYLSNNIKNVFRWYLAESCVLQLNKQVVYNLLRFSFWEIAKMVLPILLLLGFVAYATTRAQVGPLWTTKVFKPKLGKLFNITRGIKKLMFSLNTFIRLGKSLLMATAIAIAPYIVLKSEIYNIAPLFYQNAEGLAAYILGAGMKMVIYALVPMLLIAAADIWYTRWDYNENLKMTKDEVKDERKQAEGDPKIKAQQRRKMMEVMARRMMQEVPKADVVITNPTHYAIALKYDPAVAPAPICLAKGVDRVAERIKEIARENRVPIRENKPLAQALYKSVEIGESIPEELYKAVAAILAQLDRFKRGPR